jgi:hypothetical protein
VRTWTWLTPKPLRCIVPPDDRAEACCPSRPPPVSRPPAQANIRAGISRGRCYRHLVFVDATAVRWVPANSRYALCPAPSIPPMCISPGVPLIHGRASFVAAWE